MDNTLHLLLGSAIPEPATAEIKIKRLSKICGADVIFKIQELGYSRVAELKNKQESEDLGVHILLAGVVSPDLKNTELLEKYKAITPAELVKNMLNPGEIEDISRRIERLSGYRSSTIEEIKKK